MGDIVTVMAKVQATETLLFYITKIKKKTDFTAFITC